MLPMDWRRWLRGPGLWFAGATFLLFLGIVLSVGKLPIDGRLMLILLAGGCTLAGFRQAEKQRAELDAQRKTDSALGRVQRQLESQRQVVDALADGLEIAIFVLDEGAVVRYANRHAREFFKFPEPMAKPLLTVTLSHELEELVFAVREAKEERSEELTFQMPDERIGLAKAWPSPEGRLFLSVLDITDLRRLERIRRDFVANVSHELRTPLTLIRAMAETVLDDETPDPDLVSRYLPRMIGEVDRLSAMTSDLLVLSAAEAAPVRKNDCDLAATMRDVVAQLTPKAEAKGIELSYEGPDRLLLEANPAQMVQVFLNLIDNGLNYTLVGTVRVELSATDEEAVAVIADTGLGIAVDQQARVFERFYRVDKGRTRQIGGTGLGLAIVKHLVEAHGGSIELESDLGRGSAFTVRLPRGRVAISAARSPARP